VDILDHHLDRARARYASLAPRLAFEHQSIFELKAADAAYDSPCAARRPVGAGTSSACWASLKRVTKPGAGCT